MEMWNLDDDLLNICNKIGESPVEMENVRAQPRKPVVEPTDIFSGLGIDLRDLDDGDAMPKGAVKPVTQNDNVDSRKDGKPGVAYLIINNSLTAVTEVEIPRSADRYTLSAKAIRSAIMQLNGKDLAISGISDLPELIPERVEAGVMELAPGSCTFLII